MARDLIFTILGVDKASAAFGDVSRAADRAGRSLDSFGKVSTAALLGSVGAAAIAGVGIAAALGGTALAFGALGIAAVASNEQVRSSFSDLWSDIASGTREAAEPLVPVLVDISGRLSDTFDMIQPRLRGIFTNSIPAVNSLVDGVSGFALEAMPGLERAVKSSARPMDAFRLLLIDAGQGVSAFFTNISAGSASSARIVETFGNVIREALGFAGTLLANLSNQGAPAVERLGQVFTQLLGVVNQLASGAFPVLFGAAGVTLNVFSGLLSIVGGLSGALGPLLGVVVSTGVALKLLDAITFGAVTAQFGMFKAAVGGAEGITGKLKAGMGALSGGFGLAGLAAAVVGVALWQLGEAQQRAAQLASQHRNNVDSLAEALRRSNGAIDDNVRATAAKALQDTTVLGTNKNVLQVSRELGLHLPTVTDGYLNNVAAQQQLNKELDAIIKANTTYTMSGKGGVIPTLNETGKAANALKTTLSTTNGTTSEAVQKNKDLGSAQKDTAAATGEHTSALVKLQDQMLGFVSKDLAYRQAVHGERESHESMVEAIDKHRDAKAKADEVTARLGASSQQSKDAVKAEQEAFDALTSSTFAWEGGIERAVGSAGALAEAQYRGTDAAEKSRLKMEAQNAEILRLASISGNDAPPALRQMIAGMDGAALAANGVKVRVDAAGNSILELPNGKVITLTAQDYATGVIQAVQGALNALQAFKTISINMVQGALGLPDREKGGPVQAWQPYIVGEKGPEILVTGENGHIYDADTTRAVLAGSGRTGRGGMPGMGGIEKHYHLTVMNAGSSTVDLQAQFRRMEMLDGA